IQQVGREHLRQSVLPQAYDVAGATEPEVELGKVEPTPRLRDRFQPARALLVDAALEKQAVRLVLATADSPAELMQLREPEPLSALYQHDRRIGKIDAQLHDACRDQQVRVSPHEPCHPFFLLA